MCAQFHCPILIRLFVFFFFFAIDFYKCFICFPHWAFIRNMMKNILSHSVDWCLILLIVSFAMQKHFNLISSHLFIFVFAALAFGVKSKIVITKTNIKECTSYLYFLLAAFWFQILCSNQYSFWVDSCVWCEIDILFHSSTCSCPAFPAPFIEFTFFCSWLLCIN